MKTSNESCFIIWVLLHYLLACAPFYVSLLSPHNPVDKALKDFQIFCLYGILTLDTDTDTQYTDTKRLVFEIKV